MPGLWRPCRQPPAQRAAPESFGCHRQAGATQVRAEEGKADAQQMMQALQAHYLKAVRQVLAQTEDVGERFAEEARRMHYEEAPERGIRGSATPRTCRRWPTKASTPFRSSCRMR
jgi:hypothetical protein